MDEESKGERSVVPRLKRGTQRKERVVEVIDDDMYPSPSYFNESYIGIDK